MAINRIANFINNSTTAQKVLRGVNKNPAIATAGTAFVMASILRPAMIGAMPFKEKKDKQYSQASAIAAGATDLIATTLLFIPLNKSIEKASQTLYKSGDAFFKQNAPALRQFKSLTNRTIKLAMLPAISMLRFSLVKPIVNKLFGKDKDKGNINIKGENKKR